MVGKNLFLDYKRCPKLFAFNRDKPFIQDLEKREFKKRVSDFFFAGVEKAGRQPSSILLMELKKKKALKDLTFLYKELFANVHLLEVTPNGYELTEIMSKTVVREKYIDTVAFKYFILSQYGISPARCKVIKINESYTKKGEIDFFEYTEYQDITKRILKRLPKVKETIKKMLSDSQRDDKKGVACFKPQMCDYFKRCWGEIEEESVLNLIAVPIQEKIHLLRTGTGSMLEIDDNRLTNFQKIQKSSLKKPHIDREKISLYLQRFTKEICFLDFESHQPIIPFFEGMRAYEPIVFQYSLHRLKEDGTLTHCQYIANINKEDPREQIAKDLVSKIPSNATVVAYGAEFERKVIKEMARLFPNLKEELDVIREHIIDLNEPFKNRWCYFPKMGAKHSLKAVLSPLVDDLSYQDLIVANGQELLGEYKEILFGDEKHRQKSKEKLLEYCKTDTLALVKIYQKLRSWIS